MPDTLRPWSESLETLRTLAELNETLTLVFVVGPGGEAAKGLAQIGRLLDEQRTVLWHRVDRDGADLASTLATAQDPTRSVLLVHGLELVEPERRSVLARTLNLRRDALSPYRTIVVVWIARDYLNDFRRLCPDFFHWRSFLATLTREELEVDIVTRWSYIDAAAAWLQDQIRHAAMDLGALVEIQGRAAPRPLADWIRETTRGRLASIWEGRRADVLRQFALAQMKCAQIDLSEPLPVWIPLSEARMPASGADFSPILTTCPGGDQAPQAVFESWLHHGDLYLLFHGFDRLAPERQGFWKDWIGRLRIRYPGNRILVTIPAEEQTLDGWHRATLIPARRGEIAILKPRPATRFESRAPLVVQPTSFSEPKQRSTDLSSLLEALDPARGADSQVRARAAESLAQQGDSRCVSALIRSLNPEFEPDGTVRASVVTALSQVEDLRAADALRRSLDPDFEIDGTVRAGAERILRRAADTAFPDEESVASSLADEPAFLERVLNEDAARQNALAALTRLARRRPKSELLLQQVLQEHVDQLADPALTVAAEVGDPMGQVLARSVDDASEELIARLMDRCDQADLRRAVPLREIACVTTRRTLAHYREKWPEPDEQQLQVMAHLASNLGTRLSELGNLEEALEVTREAVDAQRQLAASQPHVFLPGLAMSLNNLGVQLRQLGRREETLQVFSEAVRLLRRFSASRPDTLRPELAICLTGLSVALGDAERFDEALQASFETTTLLRRLAASEGDFLADLALSLNNLGVFLSCLGRVEEALEAISEATDIQRSLATERPNTFLPDLAQSLNNLALFVDGLGRQEEALEIAREAVDIRRRLAETRPDAFMPDLASSLGNLGEILNDLGRHGEALEITREAVDIQRRLAETRPDAFMPDLASSLGNLGEILKDCGKHEEAYAAMTEAIRTLDPSFERLPEAFCEQMKVLVSNYKDLVADIEHPVNVELLAPILARLESPGEED